VTSKGDIKGLRKRSYAFTELGLAMLSSVLRSKKAIQVNIQIMRTFTKIRQLLASNRNLRLKIEEMERRYDKNFKIIFDTLKKMLIEEEKPKKVMGFTDRK
jgi:DNA-binding PadR family transcriptional regulator